MHAILFCPHHELTALRANAHQQLEQCADALLQERNIATTPILVSLIHFMVDKSADYLYPHIDRIWLGTWNAEVLADCLAHARNPQQNLPALLPHALIQRFDNIAARLHAVLLRSFLQLYSTARRRAIPTACHPASQPTVTSAPPARNGAQRRLTSLWNIPPPYIPDRHAAVCPRPQSRQRTLTSYLQPASTTAPSPAPTAAPPPTPLSSTPAAAASMPVIARTPCVTTNATARPAAASTTSTHASAQFLRQFLQRVHIPHAATNVANSTADYDHD